LPVGQVNAIILSLVLHSLDLSSSEFRDFANSIVNYGNCDDRGPRQIDTRADFVLLFEDDTMCFAFLADAGQGDVVSQQV
jgi:hypothetical protein